MEGVHDNRPLSNQVEHVVDEVVNDVVNDDALGNTANHIFLNERPSKDVKGDEFTSNYFSKKKFAPPQNEGLNEPQQDG